jgi:hypothetical protein
VARGLELDWVVIRVQPIRKVLLVAVVGLVAATLVFFAYKSLNLSPEARARRAIDRSTAAQGHAETQPLPPRWRGELEGASDQLNTARAEYAEQNWKDAESMADSARRRFEALAGAGDQATAISFAPAGTATQRFSSPTAASTASHRTRCSRFTTRSPRKVREPSKWSSGASMCTPRGRRQR